MVIILIVLAVSGMVASSQPLQNPSNAQQATIHKLETYQWQ